MSFRELPFTKNRELIADLMARARRFHMPVNATCEFDVTALRARLKRERSRGRVLGFEAFLTAATSRLLEQLPRLNRHLFTSLLGRRREIEFDEISCTLVVRRKAPTGEDILLPLVLRHSNRLTVAAIEEQVRFHQQAELGRLEQFQALERVKRLSRTALRYFSYKARSDPAFYLRYFGTYGMSTLVSLNGAAFTMSTIANTGVAFFPGTIKERPVAVRGKIVARTIMDFGFVFDHYLIDGLEMHRACEGLRDLVERPAAVLGEEAAPGADAFNPS